MTTNVVPLRAHRLKRTLRRHVSSDLGASMLASIVENAEPAQRLAKLRDNGINGLIAAALLVGAGYIVREPCECCGQECHPKRERAWRMSREDRWHIACGDLCAQRLLQKEVS